MGIKCCLGLDIGPNCKHKLDIKRLQFIGTKFQKFSDTALSVEKVFKHLDVTKEL